MVQISSINSIGIMEKKMEITIQGFRVYVGIRVSSVFPPFCSFTKLGIPFRGPNNEDYRILGPILGFPYFWGEKV